MNGDRPQKGSAQKAPIAGDTPSERTAFPWPWGLVAIGVMAIAWVGIYLIWQGAVFLFNL
ncbi:hypothetical protein VW35_18755 [Devosia soli]|uniref:Uncharacterized protein n=1 Tax=Devosia soli TaxID=361041 RepID=A0A0F5L2F3_9HYPH|nr:hypothetical protein [Devosia soli]KKB75812.1 hypothetical protein VW35_18755 [Devosia soli]